MQRSIGLIIGTMLIFGHSTATASDDDYGRAGLYGGVGAGLATSIGYADEMEDFFGLQTRVDAAIGANARVGYRVFPWLAAEGFFEWLPGFDVKTAGDDPRFPPGRLDDSKIINANTWTLSGNLKAYARSDERFQPFLELGFGYLQVENRLLKTIDTVSRGYATRMGAGIDCYIDRNWLISIDVLYVLPTGEVSRYDHISVGIDALYRF